MWFLVFLYAVRLKVISHPAFIFNIFAALFICVIAFLEIELLNDGYLYLYPDEPRFSAWAQEPFLDIINRHKRYLIYVLFSHSTYSFAGEWAFKIQSVPFALLSSLMIYDVTKQKNTLWLFPVVFGYLYFLATLNLRDSIVISAMLFFLLKISRSESKGIIIWSMFAMAFFSIIRPEYSIVCSIVMVWVLVNRGIRNKFFVLIVPSIIVTVLFVFFEDAIFGIADYFYPGRVAKYVAFRSPGLDAIPFLNDNATALVRQLFTPIPISKINFLLTHGPSYNLVVMEIFRMILMTSFYFMFLAVLFKWKKAYSYLKENRFLQVLFMLAVINTILYAIYRDGGGGTRNKLYPFILIYIMFGKMYLYQIRSHIVNLTGSTNSLQRTT